LALPNSLAARTALCCAVLSSLIGALARAVRLLGAQLLWKLQKRDDFGLVDIEKQTSAAKAA
jgi:uncharacterized Tic20 family protein